MRRTLVRAAAWVLVFVAPAAAVAAWFTPRPDLDRSDAVETALGALEEAGFDGRVAGRVSRDVHELESGDTVDVWVVPTRVEGERIELRVRRSAGQLVYVDDRIGPDDTERLLTDRQFEKMGEYRNDATTGRWTWRNVAGTVDALAIATLAHVIARRSDPLWTST